MSGPEIAVVTLVLLMGGLTILLLSQRSRSKRRTDLVLSTHGAARCQAAVELLGTLHHQAVIETCWEQIEIPLLEALPDCPPPLKSQLAEVLGTCAARCSKRELAKRIVTMRNALVN